MEYPAGHRYDALTQGGDLNTVLAAFKQRDVQLLFQFLYGNTQGGLADVTALSGTSKMLLLRQRHDVAQLSQSHGVTVSSSRNASREDRSLRYTISTRYPARFHRSRWNLHYFGATTNT